MGTTTNYSWPYPASTDPVADGAQDIQDLASGADTTVRAVELATVMRFADAAARTTALSGIEVEGMLTFLQDTDSLEYYDGASWQAVGGATMIKKVDRFTASGTWTVPTGVTYAVAHMLGGGGSGGGWNVIGNTGGTSSVAFAGGTVSALGGKGGNSNNSSSTGGASVGAQSANSGRGGAPSSHASGGSRGTDAQVVVAGAAVTAGASITVTVGAGGVAPVGASGGVEAADGGSGYVWIEYYEEV